MTMHIICLNEQRLNILRPTDSGGYFAFTHLDVDKQKRLQDLGFKEIPAPVFNITERKAFISDYNQMMDQIAVHQTHRLWWATDAASKNRFSSPLPLWIEQFVLAQRILTTSREQTLVFIGLPMGVIQSLQNIVEAKWTVDPVYTFCEWKTIGMKRLRKIAGIFVHGARVLRRIAQSQTIRTTFAHRLKANPAEIVLKTFVYNHSFTKEGDYKDVFWGALPEYFQRQGKPPVVIANVLGDFKTCVAAMQATPMLTVMPLEAFLNWRDVITAMGDVLLRPVRIRNQILFRQMDVTPIVRHMLQISFKGGVQLVQFLHYAAHRQLARAINIKQYWMTYENYPWERMAVMAIRQESPRTQILAYQHTVVPEAFLNMFPSSEEKKARLIADQIFTTGEASAQILREYGAMETVVIQPACALRFGYLFKQESPPLPKSKPGTRLLLALEASLDAAEMVSYVLKHASAIPGFEVRIRCHPLLPWAKYAATYHWDLNNYPWIHTSQGTSLKEDLQWADAVMYLSTTVSLESLKMGKPVIHYKTAKVLSWDPLFECADFKWETDKGRDLKACWDSVWGLESKEFARQQQAALAYIDRYFYPVNEQTLGGFIRLRRRP